VVLATASPSQAKALKNPRLQRISLGDLLKGGCFFRRLHPARIAAAGGQRLQQSGTCGSVRGALGQPASLPPPKSRFPELLKTLETKRAEGAIRKDSGALQAGALEARLCKSSRIHRTGLNTTVVRT
jgi:hypothetical protein